MRKTHCRSWEQAAAGLGLQHTLNSDRHGGSTMGNLVLFRSPNDLGKRMLQNTKQFVSHFHFAPKKTLQSLNPLEVRDDNTTGIAQNVRNQKHLIPALL